VEGPRRKKQDSYWERTAVRDIGIGIEAFSSDV